MPTLNIETLSLPLNDELIKHLSMTLIAEPKYNIEEELCMICKNTPLQVSSAFKI